jgi:hypothetical protein
MWLSVAFLTNASDGLRALRLLPDHWQFASGNYAFMVQMTQKYALPAWLTAMLFSAVVLWEGSAALLFWYAFGAFHATSLPGLLAVYTAFLVSLALWAAFMIADEICLAYEAEATHMRIFMAQLISLLALHLLPESL